MDQIGKVDNDVLDVHEIQVVIGCFLELDYSGLTQDYRPRVQREDQCYIGLQKQREKTTALVSLQDSPKLTTGEAFGYQ